MDEAWRFLTSAKYSMDMVDCSKQLRVVCYYRIGVVRGTVGSRRSTTARGKLSRFSFLETT
jgi:hypothetical protein